MEEKKRLQDEKQKSMNTLVTNFRRFVKEDPNRYDAGELYFVLSRLHEKHGQSIRFIMCRTIMQGLSVDPLYKEDFQSLRDEYVSNTVVEKV